MLISPALQNNGTHDSTMFRMSPIIGQVRTPGQVPTLPRMVPVTPVIHDQRMESTECPIEASSSSFERARDTFVNLSQRPVQDQDQVQDQVQGEELNSLQKVLRDLRNAPRDLRNAPRDVESDGISGPEDGGSTLRRVLRDLRQQPTSSEIQDPSSSLHLEQVPFEFLPPVGNKERASSTPHTDVLFSALDADRSQRKMATQIERVVSMDLRSRNNLVLRAGLFAWRKNKLQDHVQELEQDLELTFVRRWRSVSLNLRRHDER